MIQKKIFLLLPCFVISCLPNPQLCGQEGTDITGQILQPENTDFSIPFADLGIKLLQQAEFPKPPLPANWEQMELEQREAWFAEFRESDAGRKFIANNQRIQESIEVFDVILEKNGKFTLYDVPDGRYAIQGHAEQKLQHRKYAFDIFGQVDVLKGVDLLELDPIMIVVTPILEVGQSAPEFSLKTAEGSGKISSDQFHRKYLFLNFWSTESPPSIDFQDDIQKMYVDLKSKHPIELLSVSVDADKQQAISHIRKSSLKGQHGFTGGWDNPMLESFGIRGIPSHWLIGPDGKILLTELAIRRALFSGRKDLAKIVEDQMRQKRPGREQSPAGQDKPDR